MIEILYLGISCDLHPLNHGCYLLPEVQPVDIHTLFRISTNQTLLSIKCYKDNRKHTI